MSQLNDVITYDFYLSFCLQSARVIAPQAYCHARVEPELNALNLDYILVLPSFFAIRKSDDILESWVNTNLALTLVFKG